MGYRCALLCWPWYFAPAGANPSFAQFHLLAQDTRATSYGWQPSSYTPPASHHVAAGHSYGTISAA